MTLLVVVITGIFVLWWKSHQDVKFIEHLLLVNRETYLADSANLQQATLAAIHDNRLLLLALHPQPREKKVILVVDDDESMRGYTHKLLVKAGYDVRTAVSAEDALRLLMKYGLPDLIVADIRLPKMSGLEFTSQIRWAGCRMPIIAYSAYGSAFDTTSRHEALMAGCSDFIAKTGQGGPLVDAIAQWLSIAESITNQGKVEITSP